MTTSWRRLGRVDPRALVEPRLMLHHAAQLVTAVGRSLLPPRSDDGQTAFEWSEEVQALVGEVVPGERPWRAALRPADLTLLVLDVPPESAEAFLLAGRNLTDAFAWLRERARERGADASQLSREVPYDVPAHAVAREAAFPPTPLPGFAELARCFADADRLFRAYAAGRPDASAVRCWPHHFDLGALLTLSPWTGGRSPTVGFGLSPGDDGVGEPYFYVNAWPRPEPRPDALPPLPAGGRWNLEGWLGAVLPVSALVETRDEEGQEARAREFLIRAVGAARALLGRPEADAGA
jgi:hypothetical protein